MAHFMSMRLQRGGRQQYQILVVEDQVFSRKLLCEMLYSKFLVDAAASVREAWQLYLEKAHDIIFIDIELDDANGHALANIIKKLDPSACVAMVTGNNSVEDVECAIKNNVDGFIVKPFSKQKIYSCIEKYMGVRKTTFSRGDAK
jgi:DNA-binding NtrC family response regulator